MTEKTFIFKYDPNITPEKMFANLRQAWQGKLKLVEPHIVKSNSIKALLCSLTEERLELFSTLVQKRPASLEQLAGYLGRDYQAVKKDSELVSCLRSN
jgi:predicted transcriptional regulator